VRLLCVCLIIAAIAPTFSSKAQTQIPLVDVRSADPTIAVDLRYATPNNFTGRPLYPAGTPALIRPEVAQRLAIANQFLRRHDYRLKIWDAYRPPSAQAQLWQASPKNDFVANPDAGAGSLHSWGIAVDATLADRFGQDVKMPTEYDDFTPAAMWKYIGPNQLIRHHLITLQMAMRDAGFYGLRSEWWHFTVKEWQSYLPPEEAKRAAQAFGLKWQGKL